MSSPSCDGTHRTFSSRSPLTQYSFTPPDPVDVIATWYHVPGSRVVEPTKRFGRLLSQNNKTRS